ncbi:MAG TPA: Wzz/FepE/Etk N-terminal domain-containing protein [Puia sp.]|nr:Wzz/FepE/Etk N-terminal domain-containing protein [Puia sp.]
MDLAYLFRILLKRKWIILGSAVLAAVVAWILTRNQQKYYFSTTRISTGFAIPDEIKINESSGGMYDAEVKFNNAINTWTSPSVLSLLSYELILHDMTSPRPFRTLTAAQKQSSSYKSVNAEAARKTFEDKLETMSVLTSYKPEEKALLEYLNLYGYGYKYLITYLNVFKVQATDYIEVDCKTENPELSAFMVNRSYAQFLRLYKNIRSTKSQESIDTLESIMEKKKQEYDEKQKLVRDAGLTDVAAETSSQQDLIAQSEQQLADENDKQTDYSYQLRRIEQKLEALGGPATGGAKTNVSPNNNEELLQARKAMNDAYNDYLKTNDKDKLTRYNQLKQEYYDKYVNSTPVTSGGNNTSTERNDLLEKKQDLEVTIQAGKDKIKNITARIATLRSTASSTSSRNAAVEALLQEAKMAEKDYFDARQRYANATEIGSSSVNNFRQLQIAQPAIEPEPSKRMIIVGMAGLVTCVTAVLIIVILSYLDSSVRTPAIFSKEMNLKLISIVNFMNMRNKALRDVITGNLKEKGVSEKKRSNTFRESIRKLRYEIEHSGKRIFLFTSTKKGQGKTTLIQALSYSLSMSKKKILIIDTNFSNNDLTVQLHGDPVLEKISNEDLSVSPKLKVKVFSKDIGAGSGGIFIIGSQGGDYTPSEVLPSENNLLIHLQAMLEEFDYIFLEGPPLNDFSDSRELVDYVEGVVAVFSATDIIKQIDKESAKFFKDLNGKFCGSILNMIDLENVNVI